MLSFSNLILYIFTTALRLLDRFATCEKYTMNIYNLIVEKAEKTKFNNVKIMITSLFDD